MDVKYLHARILRETVAYYARRAHPQERVQALSALSTYAKLVSKYCDHPEMVNLQTTKKCLDCGYEVPI